MSFLSKIGSTLKKSALGGALVTTAKAGAKAVKGDFSGAKETLQGYTKEYTPGQVALETAAVVPVGRAVGAAGKVINKVAPKVTKTLKTPTSKFGGQTASTVKNAPAVRTASNIATKAGTTVAKVGSKIRPAAIKVGQSAGSTVGRMATPGVTAGLGAVAGSLAASMPTAGSTQQQPAGMQSPTTQSPLSMESLSSPFQSSLYTGSLGGGNTGGGATYDRAGRMIINEKGEAIVPDTGLQGQGGFPQRSASFVSPTIGAAGGGIPNFLGIIGTGARGAGGASFTGEGDESGGIADVSRARDMAQKGAFVGPTAAGILNEPAVEALRTPALPDEIPTEGLGRTDISRAGVDLDDDRGVYQQKVATGIQNNFEKNLAGNDVPPNSVEDTPAQEDFLSNLPPVEQSDLRAAIDEIKLSLGYSEHLKTRNEAQAMLSSIAETYAGVIDDIKNNPDLPKGLAQRRLAAVFEDQKFAMLQAQALFDQAQLELDNIDDAVNREIGIFEAEDARRNRTIDNNRQMLQLMISSGAIGGLSDSELSQWAEGTSVPEGMLRKARENALSVDPQDALKQQKLQAEINKINAQAAAAAKGSSSSGNVASTAGERAIQAVATFSGLFIPGAAYEGKPVLDADGYITPDAWVAAIEDAPNAGLSRKQFITEFGHRIPMHAKKKELAKYRLTAKEKQLITT